MKRMKMEMLVHLHNRVETNRACSSRLTTRVKIAMLMLSMAPAAAIAVGLYTLGGFYALAAAFIAALGIAFVSQCLTALSADLRK